MAERTAQPPRPSLTCMPRNHIRGRGRAAANGSADSTPKTIPSSLPPQLTRCRTGAVQSWRCPYPVQILPIFPRRSLWYSRAIAERRNINHTRLYQPMASGTIPIRSNNPVQTGIDDGALASPQIFGKIPAKIATRQSAMPKPRQPIPRIRYCFALSL